MCWSATADLAAGGAVAAVGVVRVAYVRRVRDLPLGVHQMIESVVWHDASGAVSARIAWAVTALSVLPVLMPLGVATAVGLGAGLAYEPVTAQVRGHTLGYGPGLPGRRC